MKTTLLLLTLAAAAAASAQSVGTSAPPPLRSTSQDRLALRSESKELATFARAYAPAASGDKNAQVWVGVASLAYERFSGANAGDEFGITPTGYLGYQRNFYPEGRLTNSIGYSVGIGVAALGAAVFYHQGAASSHGVDFRAGVAADFVYFDDFSYFGGSNFILLPFVSWGIKI